MRWRFTLLISCFLLVFSFLIFHIYTIQIQKGGLYVAKAASQYRATLLAPHRGIIYFTDKNNNAIPVAINKKFPVIFAVPKEIVNSKEAATLLQPILGTTATELQRLFSKPHDSYELLLKKASPEQVEKIKALNLAGIYSDEEEGRFYPFQNLAANVIGFVGPSSNDSTLAGRYGLEAGYDDILAGSAGQIDGRHVTPPNQGSDLYVTIDRNVQVRAEAILNGLMEKYSAAEGTVIVEEPATGKILALANAPTFDPNDYAKSPLQAFRDPAIQSLYEPGSIFKVLTMSAGIDSGRITPATTYTDSGFLTLNGKTIRNWDLKAHGSNITMTQVIEDSINTGAAFAEKQTGHNIFLNYLGRFGLEKLTGIKLPGEIGGNIKNLKKNPQDINFATAAFGQGVAVTPIELITAISALANHGVMMRPLILQSEKPETLGTPMTEATAEQVTQMMVSAVKKARIAQIPNYHIAGKTGTAQIPDFKKGGYSEEFIHTYVGFAPASNPKFITLLKLDKPKGITLAGSSVVPAFRELADFLLNYYTLPPDNIEKQ